MDVRTANSVLEILGTQQQYYIKLILYEYVVRSTAAVCFPSGDTWVSPRLTCTEHRTNQSKTRTPLITVACTVSCCVCVLCIAVGCSIRKLPASLLFYVPYDTLVF